MELFTPLARTSLDLYGVKPGDFVAGFTGAHGMANGLDAVLDAAAELKRLGRKNIKLGLIGGGNQKDALVARAQRESLDNCLFFAPRNDRVFSSGDWYQKTESQCLIPGFVASDTSVP